nr:glycosyltransferase [Flavobacteriaceae bacterium]
PAYNVAPYIAECLQSVLSQTFSDWEAIVIDDGSTDETASIIKEFSDSRIRLIEQENAGLSATRNNGIALAKGDFVLCLDSDDRLNRETLQICYEIAQKEQVKAVTFDGYDFKTVENKEQILPKGYFDRSSKLKEGIYTGQEFLRMEVLQKAVVVSAPFYFVKKEVLQKVPFEVGMLHEDVLFHYELVPLLETIYYVPKKFYQRRLRENSIVHSIPTLKNLEAYQKIIAVLTQKLREVPQEQQKIYRKIIAKNMLQVGKLGKRYLLAKGTDKSKVLAILKQIIFSDKFCLQMLKFWNAFLGGFYYLVVDLRS